MHQVASIVLKLSNTHHLKIRYHFHVAKSHWTKILVSAFFLWKKNDSKFTFYYFLLFNFSNNRTVSFVKQIFIFFFHHNFIMFFSCFLTLFSSILKQSVVNWVCWLPVCQYIERRTFWFFDSQWLIFLDLDFQLFFNNMVMYLSINIFFLILIKC